MRSNSSYKKTVDSKRGNTREACVSDDNHVSSAELATKRTAISMAVLILTGLLANNSLMAEPTGGVVVPNSGTATITNSVISGQHVTNINQTTDSVSIKWQSFNIGTNETVKFSQPSPNAVAINTILGLEGTQILGKLTANGKVWLINPNGVFFGPESQVNVGGLLATTLNTLNSNAGSQKFQGDSLATVENQGTILATGGYVVLMGHTAKNLGTGTIKADGGTAALAAGSDISLQFQNNPRISIVVNANQLGALASNGGLVQANGGQVMLNAGATNSILSAAVNNSGTLLAKSTVSQKGKITLSANGTNSKLELLAGSKLDASAQGNAQGGDIETLASIIQVDSSAQVDTTSDTGAWGNWSIIQNNQNQTGSEANISSIFMGNALGDSLNSSNITLVTKKDIAVDMPLTWGAATKLTLSAGNNIYIKKSITANNSLGSLALKYGQGSRNGSFSTGKADYSINAKVNLMEGENFSTVLGSTGSIKKYYVITRLGLEGSLTTQDLQGINGDITKNYALGSDIDATETANWGEFMGVKGFYPIGGTTRATTSQGLFDGLGHTVDHLSMRSISSENIGMFGYAYNAEIRNLGLTNVSISGRFRAGGIAGYLEGGAIKNSYTTGLVKGIQNVGGLAGLAISNTVISNSYSTADITGSGENGGGVGGLVGMVFNGKISNSYSTGNIQGTESVGGLIGFASIAAIDNSYSLATISGTGPVEGKALGGLVGLMQYTTIRSSFANIKIRGEFIDKAGGLVGGALTNNIISDSYSLGDINVNANFVGGLVGSIGLYNQVSNSMASVDLYGTFTQKGGLTGFVVSRSTIQNSFWDLSKNQQGYYALDRNSIINSKGLTPEQLKQEASFAGFDFNNKWTIYEGLTTPLLRSFMQPLTLKIKATQAQIYNADTQYYGDTSIEYQGDASKLFGLDNYKKILSDKNVGQRYVTATGIYSGQLGYLIEMDHSQSNVEITKAPITVTGITAESKVYDGNQSVKNLDLSHKQINGVYAADQTTVTVNVQGGTFDNKDVGDNKRVENITTTLGGENGGNYYITSPTIGTGSITPANFTALSGTKKYDGTNQFSNVNLTGVNGETFAVANATSNSANVSSHPENAARKFSTANGVSEVAGSLGKTSNYNALDLKNLKSNEATVTPADFTSIKGSKEYDGNSSFQQALITGVNSETFNISAEANSKNASNNSVNPARRFDRVIGGLVATDESKGDLRNYKNFSLDDKNLDNQAVITPKDLSVNGLKAKDKVYDGTTMAQVDTTHPFVTGSGLVNGDVVTVSSVTGKFEDANVGKDKTVGLSNPQYAGVDKSNYRIIDQKSSSANILQAANTQDTGNKTNDSTQNVPVIPNTNKNQNNLTDPIARNVVQTSANNMLWNNLESDYWFSDCLFTYKNQSKLIRCEPLRQNKALAYEIKNYSIKKYSASNSILMTALPNKSD